jgi:hypothetical protein
MNGTDQDPLPDSPQYTAAARAVAGFFEVAVEFNQELIGQCDELKALSLRRLLARGAKLLKHHHRLDVGSHHPHTMLDSSDFYDLYMRNARVVQVEIVLGMKLIEGLGLDMVDIHCAQIGANLFHEFHAELILSYEREIQMWNSADWAGLLLAGIVSYEEYTEFKERCPVEEF